MTLSTRQRTSIYQKLVPVLGEEDADALMTEFPAAEHEQLVTREHLRAELTLVRSDMTAEFAAVRGEMAAEFAAVRGEIADLRGDLHQQLNRSIVAMAGVTVTAVIAGMGVAAALS